VDDAGTRAHDEERPGSLTRRTVLGAGALATAGAVAPAAASAQRRLRVLGAPRDGTNALEVFGTIVQDGITLTGYGYLTRVSGLRDQLLYDGAQSEAGARFTFAATARVSARQIRGSLFAVVAQGDLEIFFSSVPGADFAQPASFTDGTLVASYSSRYRNVLTVVAPDQAITTVTGEIVQRQARRFRLAGRTLRLGRVGLGLRLEAQGPGVRTDPAIPRAVFDVAGHVLVA